MSLEYADDNGNLQTGRSSSPDGTAANFDVDDFIF